jgi:hypothetical protein
MKLRLAIDYEPTPANVAKIVEAIDALQYIADVDVFIENKEPTTCLHHKGPAEWSMMFQ